MGTYNLPRNVKGEGRILFIFTPKSLLFAVIGVAIGLVFYVLFSLMNLNVVGIIFIIVFALIGYGIAMLKVPNIGISKTSKVVAGQNMDDVIKRAILFKKISIRLYVYDN